MKPISCILIFCMIIMLSLFLFNCSNIEEDSAKVVVDLGLSELSDAANNKSTISSMIYLRKIIITITADDIRPIEKVIDLTKLSRLELLYLSRNSDVIIEVPAGLKRTVTVTGEFDPANPSAVLSYQGRETVSLKPSSTAYVSVTMCTKETKLVIPDQLNDRVVQMTDIYGTDWEQFQLSASPIDPYDIDFDCSGSIYIANGSNLTIERIDDIQGTNRISININYSSETLAIDRKNDRLYYPYNGRSFVIRMSNLEGTEFTDLDLSRSSYPVSSIKGMDVDGDGNLYLVGTSVDADQVSTPMIFKYNPSRQIVTNTYTGDFNELWDIVVKPNGFIVCNYDNNLRTDSNHKIALFSPYLRLPHYVTSESFTRFPDSFYGPHRFIAKTNNILYVLDEDDDYAINDRIIAIDNLNDAQWEINEGDAKLPFAFFITNGR